MICAICMEKDPEVLLFNDEKLEKCKIILHVRINNNLKYSEVVFPNDVDSEVGYHVKCYRKFTAVMKKYFNDPSLAGRSFRTSESTSEVSEIPEENTMENTVNMDDEHGDEISDEDSEFKIIVDDTVGAECFFCGKMRKSYRGTEQRLYATSKGTVNKFFKTFSAVNDSNLMWERF